MKKKFLVEVEFEDHFNPEMIGKIVSSELLKQRLIKNVKVQWMKKLKIKSIYNWSW